MSRLSRVTQVIFGNGASDIGVFGSAAVGTPTTSTVIATIMAAAAWGTGWLSAVLGATKLVAVEDLNAVDYVTTTQLAYLFQQGLAVEYDAGTTYFNSTTQSVVMQPGTLNLFASLTDNNTGNALPTAPASNSHWSYLGNLSNLSTTNLFTGGTTTGSANAQILASLTPATGFSMSNAGDTITCTAGFTNTGAATLAITSPAVSAKAIRKNSGSGLVALTGGEIVAGNIVTFTVDVSNTYLVLDAGLPATLFLQTANALSELTGSAATARSNISAAKSGANTDITSLNGSALIFTPYGVGSWLQASCTSNVSGGGTVSASALTPAIVNCAPEGSSGPVPGSDSITGTYMAIQNNEEFGASTIGNWMRIA